MVCAEEKNSHAFSRAIVKSKLLRPGFELGLPCSFPKMITITLHLSQNDMCSNVLEITESLEKVLNLNYSMQ